MAETIFKIRGPLPPLRDTSFLCRWCGANEWREERDAIPSRTRLVCAGCGYKRAARYLRRAER